MPASPILTTRQAQKIYDAVKAHLEAVGVPIDSRSTYGTMLVSKQDQHAMALTPGAIFCFDHLQIEYGTNGTTWQPIEDTTK